MRREIPVGLSRENPLLVKVAARNHDLKYGLVCSWYCSCASQNSSLRLLDERWGLPRYACRI